MFDYFISFRFVIWLFYDQISKTSINSDVDLVSDNVAAIQHQEDLVKAYSVSEASVFDDDQTGESVEVYLLIKLISRFSNEL